MSVPPLDFSIFNTLLDAVLVVDEEWNILYANEATAALTGWTTRRLKPGTPITTVFTFDQPIVEEKLQDITRPTPYREVRFTTNMKRQGAVRVSIQPVGSNESSLRWLLFIRDMEMEVALEKKYRRAKSERTAVLQVAQKDLLTKCYNRSIFLKLTGDACEWSEKTKKPLTLLLADIDNFSLINEFHGTEVGDRLLVDFANTILNGIAKPGMVVGRLESNLFGLLCMNLSDSNAILFSKELRRKLSEIDFKLTPGKFINITISCGIGVRTYEKTGRDLFEKARRPLNESKKAGKNRVAIA
jgi:diguanylate cyclase (GGDEF)-like protein/PAS domain S-box-containing protein